MPYPFDPASPDVTITREELAAGALLTHTYDDPGAYPVVIRAYIDEDTDLEIVATHLTVGYTPLALARAGMGVTLTTELEVSASYAIAWGDDATETVAAIGDGVTHTYTVEGDYTVTVIYTDDGDNDVTAELLATVAPYILTLSMTPTADGRTVTVTPDAVAEAGEGAYHLDWGNGVSSIFAAAVACAHTYHADGVYPISATLIAVDDAAVHASALAVAKEPDMFVTVTIDGLTGRTLTASVTASDPAAALMLFWGDGAQSAVVADSPVSHAYASGQRARLVARGMTRDGQVAQSATHLVITPATGAVASVLVFEDDDPSHLRVYSSDDVGGWRVSYGEYGHTIDPGDPFLCHLDTGEQTIEIAWMLGETSVIAGATVVVAPVPPAPTLTVGVTAALTGTAALAVTTVDATLASASISWGDGETDEVDIALNDDDIPALEETVTHLYAAPGTYYVRLTVTDSNDATATSTPVALTIPDPDVISLQALGGVPALDSD
jgi:PKD repeat protein